MRKRLFIFAAATCFALSAFATPAFAEKPGLPDGPTIGSEASDGNEDGLHNGSDDGPTDDSSTVGGEQEKDNGNATPGASHDPVVGGSAGSAMTLAGTIAVQNVLQDWINSNPASPSGSATFTLGDDFTTDQGLLFTGNPADPADSRQTFIIDAQSHNITLNDYGIGATYCNVIIKNCNTLTIKAHQHKVLGVFASACYFGHATLTLDNCTNVTIENDLEKGQGHSGISVYDEGNLYFQKNTNVTISGYMAKDCSGIYMDREDADYDKIMGQIVVSDNSTLTATKCYHNGITANPVDVNVTNNSEIKVYQNGDASKPDAHQGGIGCYYGTMTISGHSRVTSNDNSAWFGIFVHNLDVDETSEIESRYDTIYGIAFNGNAVLQSGAKMTSVGHWGPGIALYDFKDSKGSLTVQKDAILSSSSANVGLANGGNNFNVLAGAQVYLNDNVVGLDNYPNATYYR